MSLNIGKRLALYRSMRIDYFVSAIFPFMKTKLFTNLGFCHYLYCTYGSIIELYDLDELTQEHRHMIGKYWFIKGDAISRFKLLFRAVKKCKKNLKSKNVVV